jgi:hypothetical protein
MKEPEKDQSDVIFTSDESLVVVFEGPGDSTRRPRRPNNPREWPRLETPRQSQPPAQPPKADGSSA